MIGDASRCQGIIEVDDLQLRFLETLAVHRGNLEKAYELIPCTEAAKATWVADILFWNAVQALRAQMLRSGTLTVDFVRDHMVSAATGESKPTRTQMQAINLASRVLGLGLAGSGRMQGKVTIQPGEVEVTFTDGELPIAGPETQPGAISGPNRPIPIDLDNRGQGELK